MNQFDCAAGSQPRPVSRGDLVRPVESSACQEGVAAFCRPIVSYPFVGQKSIAVDMSAIVQEHIHVYVCMCRIQNIIFEHVYVQLVKVPSHLCRPVVIEFPFFLDRNLPLLKCVQLYSHTYMYTCALYN